MQLVSRSGSGREQSVALLQDRVRDFVVVLDEMARWNTDDLFASRIDVQTAAAMGWSYGAGQQQSFAGSILVAERRSFSKVAAGPHAAGRG
jgi:predicted dienelactone hydrolase